MAAATILLLLSGLAVSQPQLCYPDQSLEECLLSQETPEDSKDGVKDVDDKEDLGYDDLISTRSSFITGRFCFSDSGYYGACAKAKNCVRRNYSYSRTCGWKQVCCQGGTSGGQDKKQTRRTTSRAPFRRKTTRAPFRRTTSRAPFRRTTTRASFRRRTTRASSPRTSTGSCGVSPVNFIYGGEEAKKGQFPFMVSFVYKYTPSYVENFCGGVLISRRHVLTAAHCFDNKKKSEWQSGEVDVRIGQTDLDNAEDPLASANIKKVTIHPDYQKRAPGTLSPVNDIAIVTLDRSIASPRVTTVCLPSAPTSPSKGLVAGWGSTSQGRGGSPERKLQFAYLDTYSVEECQAKYDKVLAGRAKVVINQDMLCAGNTKADSCAGDSGGPMLHLDQAFRWTVSGVVSFGPSSCGNIIPGVYSRVDRYTDWIDRQMKL
eukprot:GFUD01084341.1.p1 GENE.GFUD01084341.1~~GFUD01084341.1.p1  ORF type:complete len:431 (+),score=121.84 GFUD01084341.1:180-1472(+)